MGSNAKIEELDDDIMLIPLDGLVRKYNMSITGAIHVGAHEAEEQEMYNSLGINKVIWVEGNPQLAQALKERFIHNLDVRVFNEVLSDHVGEATFHFANNGQSSSILELGTHAQQHPEVVYTGETTVTTNTLDKLYVGQFSGYNFLNLDVQGAELMVLKGAAQTLFDVDYIYTEVNREHLYEGCCLVEELDAYLTPWGFRRVETEFTVHNWGDSLYCKEGSF